MTKVTSTGDDLHEMSNTVLIKINNKKNIINLSSAESAQRVVKVKGSIFLKNRHFYPRKV